MRYGADEEDPWTIYWVHFSGRDMDTFNRSFGIGLFDGPRPIAFNEKGLQLWDTMYQTLEMGYSKDNLSNTNLCLYHLIATFLFPDKHRNEKQQDAKDMINETISYMRKDVSARLTIEDGRTIYPLRIFQACSGKRRACRPWIISSTLNYKGPVSCLFEGYKNKRGCAGCRL